MAKGSYQFAKAMRAVKKAAKRAKRIKSLEKRKIMGSVPLARLSNSAVKKLYKVYK
jgi:hypothetical protein